MRKIVSGLLAVSAAVTAIPAVAQDYGYGGRDAYYGRDYRDYGRHDDRGYGRGYGRDYGRGYGHEYRGYGGYDERTAYYSGPRWRGQDGRYYCRRSDGTTGLIVGGVAGALVGSAVGGRDGGAGALLGGVLGALAGRAVDRDGARCR